MVIVFSFPLFLMNQHVHALFLHELKDLYDAEHQLVDALSEMSVVASNEDLRIAFDQHRAQTQDQISRLEEVFRSVDASPERVTCTAMKGLIAEGMKTLKERDWSPEAKDVALIGAARRVEHYEQAAYESAWALARSMDHAEAADLLEQTRAEEASTDKKLMNLGNKLLGITLVDKASAVMA